MSVERLPAAKVAAMLHKGSYLTLDGTLDEMFARLPQMGYQPTLALFLRMLYWNSPDNTPAEELLTEIRSRSSM